MPHKDYGSDFICYGELLFGNDKGVYKYEESR